MHARLPSTFPSTRSRTTRKVSSALHTPETTSVQINLFRIAWGLLINWSFMYTTPSSTSNNRKGIETTQWNMVDNICVEAHGPEIGRPDAGAVIEDVPVPKSETENTELSEPVNMGSFPEKLTPRRLSQIAESKNLDALTELGGIEGILDGLGTDPKRGLSGSLSKGTGSVGFVASLEERRRVYGANVVPSRKTKSFLELMWIASKQRLLILLTVAAVVALALGLFQDFGTARETFTCGQGETCYRPQVNWVKGVAIAIAVIVVVSFSSVNDWQKERQFKELNEKKEDRSVKVIRDGSETVINIKELVVGDVIVLEPGEVTPCDGIFISGSNVRCDESSITGESDAIKKISYLESLKLKDNGETNSHADCFVISGSKVLEGVGTYVSIAVGERSLNGRIMMSLRTDTENTPLQQKLEDLGRLVATLASTVCLILFVALLIRFFVELGRGRPARTSSEKGQEFIDILVISVSLFVVAVPEGLPLAVTLALALATKRMMKEMLLVRVLASCETMANASVVCTDKTGTLTQNSMTVVAGAIGVRGKFVRHLKDNPSRANVGEEPGLHETREQKEKRQKHPDDFVIDQQELEKILPAPLRRCMNDAICVNSTAFEDVDQTTGKRGFVGSKTETALLQFAKDLGWPDYQSARQMAEIVEMIPFSSERKAMGVVVRLGEGHWRLYLKGASEVLTKNCTRHVLVSMPDEHYTDDFIRTDEIDSVARDNINRTITFYASQALRTIALCYRDLNSWPPEGVTPNGDEIPYNELTTDLTLIGVIAIEDPLRDGVSEAVSQCRRAGVEVKMCTGDNVMTARSIAAQCGIYTPGGVVMEGPTFRELDDRELLEVVPRLQVLARSSPEDKKILVEKLKELGEIVAVTGDGTNDGPALKNAHVGFSMGLSGTEIAKEASDIVLMDDNFSNIVKAIMEGRCVNDAIRKFLQCQLSANIAAVIMTFVTALQGSTENSALTAVQLLWVNIVINGCAAVALATDPASPRLLDRKPERMNSSLFTVDMYKQILGQALYQATIVLIFHFAGDSIFGFRADPNNEAVEVQNYAILSTLVFNAFVFANIFNLVNCRSIDSSKNILAGIHRNVYFIGIFFLETAVQITIVFVGSHAFSVTDVEGKYWGISLALGIVSIPLGFLLRCIPNGPVERFFRKMRLIRDPSVLPIERPNAGARSVQSRPVGHLMSKLACLVRGRRSSVALSRTETLVGSAEIKSGPSERSLPTMANEPPASDSEPVTPIQVTHECAGEEKDNVEEKRETSN